MKFISRFALPLITLLFTALATELWVYYFNGLNQEDLRTSDTAIALTKGNPNNGYHLIVSYGCGGCHTIPGIPGAAAKVGPSLTSFPSQATIAGVMQNSADNLIRWIQHPREVDSQTAMPDLGVTDQEARDIAAYLYAPL
jgi:cytochrome c1